MLRNSRAAAPSSPSTAVAWLDCVWRNLPLLVRLRLAEGAAEFSLSEDAEDEDEDEPDEEEEEEPLECRLFLLLDETGWVLFIFCEICWWASI